MLTIHANLWTPGDPTSLDGFTCLILTVSHMTRFAMVKPILKRDSTEFLKSMCKIMLRYGISHMMVTDPNSKFKGEFDKMCNILDKNTTKVPEVTTTLFL